MSGPRAQRPIRFTTPDGTPVTIARGVPLDGPLGELARQHAPEAYAAALPAPEPPAALPTAPPAEPLALGNDSPASADEASTAEALSRRKTTTR